MFFIGIIEVQAAAYKVELLGRNDRLGDAGEAIEDLVRAIDRLQPALERLSKGR